MASVTTALIACGALAREVLALRERHGWDADVLGVPALLHNRPDRIPDAVLARIREARKKYDDVIVVYGDCGTAGRLDQLLAAEGVRRVAGPHCFEMYAGCTWPSATTPPCASVPNGRRTASSCRWRFARRVMGRWRQDSWS